MNAILKRTEKNRIKEITLDSRWLLLLGMVETRKQRVYDDIYKELEALAMKDERIREAFETWEELSRTPDELIAYESRLKAIIDEEARLADAKREGKEEEKIQTSHNLLQINSDIETIVQATGLTKDDIMKIQKKSLF